MEPKTIICENRKGKQLPCLLYKYYSPSGIEIAISDDTIKWELPCGENDPFEALAIGWDREAIRRELGSTRNLDTALLDELFKSRRIQEKISHIVAFVSFAEKNDRILMWSHYAEKHTGACIEFDTSKLGPIVSNFTPVEYAHARCAERKAIPLPHDSLDDSSDAYQDCVREFLSYKANDWAYEEEWRLIIPPMAKFITTKRVGNRHILVSTIPTDAVRRLIFGCNTPVTTRLALAKQMQKKHPSCQFAEAVPNPRLFKLDIVPLEIDAILASELNGRERPLKVSRRMGKTTAAKEIDNEQRTEKL